MAYEKQMSRAEPGCILFLVDQSGSMREPVFGTTTPKHDVVADQVNKLLHEFVLACSGGHEGIKHRLDIGVIGYGASVGPAFGGALAKRELASIVEIADGPLSTDGDPVWIRPTAAGRTPMREAMNTAGRLMTDWSNTHPDSFPPIVINISDGAATDGDAERLTGLAAQLRGLQTRDGGLLYFNINVSARKGTPLLFPASASELPADNDYAQVLFEMSSRLTPKQVEEAERFGATKGSRGFAFNSDVTTLREFLKIGTLVLDDRPTV